VGATTGLQRSIEALEKAFDAVDEHEEGQAQANFVRDELVVAMNACRGFSDTLEGLVDDALWPLPKYRELLFAH
jgi:glutamine synthetase